MVTNLLNLTTQNIVPLQWSHKIFGIDKVGFEQTALEIFRFQYDHNALYAGYANAVHKSPDNVNSLLDIPFLPIRFFKSHEVKTTSFESDIFFESSGTTGTINSRHFIKNIALYEESFLKGFEQEYGKISDWCIIGLLPSYLERKNASLVYMVQELINKSGHSASGFYLDEFEKLSTTLITLEATGQKTLLIGVTYALLDFAEKFPQPLQHTVIMETGGMKGRRRELIRDEVHQILKNAFSVSAVHSEYGMTELLSQAYSPGEGLFFPPAWMQILIRDEEDPLLIKENGKGIINVIDLANVYSCSFIATDDAGIVNADGCFEVLGRVDGSDLRGCSLMAV